ncbi:SAM hydrolase/SAM-dependent halogenase family protein [Thiobacter aerophilum]|uniref:SAM-dependent chlorinase/fluorinase n=1 Tax=Thiobacter aerophilum TaxID=3121275 RepID=A0ABV0ECG9_9BURK
MSVFLFTDFGASDLYVGQVKAVFAQQAPGIPVIDLLHEVPAYDIEAGAHLLAALASRFAVGDVCLAVVDPGVGGSRRPAVVQADGRWFVGPDNGLMSVVMSRARERRIWHITWQPSQLSVSFHGRDLFAPMAARLARQTLATEDLQPAPTLDVLLAPGPVARVIYVDHYGNCFTGLPAAGLSAKNWVECGPHRIPHGRTFSAAPSGRPFWYGNSIGLVEIAVPKGHAAQTLGLKVGSVVRVL